MLEWNKGKNTHVDTSADYIQQMANEMDGICELLMEDTNKFNKNKFFEKIHEYIVNNERLIYTQLTNYIFTIENEEKFGIMQTNIDSVVNYMYGEEYKEYYAKELNDRNKKREYERTQRTILKLWDHINLARRQYHMFQQNDEDYTKIVDSKMQDAETRISKEMSTQLIALVSIFTALSFLVFGGISSLDNIFLGAKDIPTLKLLIVGCIWCFCIMNLVFVFMFFVSKLTGLSIKSNDNLNANLVKKYPMVCWCNFAILSILCIACWIYYVRRYGYSQYIDNFISQNPTLFVLFGIGVIFLFMIIVAKKIYKMWKT